jgi:hypothetical protein
LSPIIYSSDDLCPTDTHSHLDQGLPHGTPIEAYPMCVPIAKIEYLKPNIHARLAATVFIQVQNEIASSLRSHKKPAEAGQFRNTYFYKFISFWYSASSIPEGPSLLKT